MNRVSILRLANACSTLFSFALLVTFTFTSAPLQAQLIDRVVAVVNDEVITLSELDTEGEKVFRQIAATTPAEHLESTLADARADILNTLIDKRLIAQKAKERNIKVTDKEVDAAFHNVLQRTGMSKDQLLLKLAETGLDEEGYRSTLESQILQSRLVGTDVHAKIVITEEMVLDHYDEHYTTRAEGGSYYLLQMGFSWQDQQGRDLSQAALDANKLDARKRAERIHSLASAGQDFGNLARKHSDLPSKADGGDIGTFLLEDMNKDMRDAVSGLQTGQVSEIIETPVGYQFFKALSAGDDAIIRKASYETVKDEIKQELYEKEVKKAYAEWVRELKDQAYIQKL